jgi:hypothetical protein
MSNIRGGHLRRTRAAVSLLTRGALLAVGATVATGCSSPAGSSVAKSGSAGHDSGGCIDCFTLEEPDGGVLIGSSSGVPTPGMPDESALTPTFSTVVTASVPPPPISGGTLLVTSDGTHAVAADPDRDSLYVVDLHAQAVAFTISLNPGDEPGRLVQDGAGRVHVALRSGGALVTIDPTTGSILDRRSVCPAPRGVAWDASTDLVWVACATGEVVALPSAGGAATTSFTVERDLRDVIVSNGSLAVSEFRSAEVLRLAGDGAITRRDALPSPTTGFVPHVAWRAVPGPAGTIVTLHQAESTTSLVTTMQGGYGCGGGNGGVGGGGDTAPALIAAFDAASGVVSLLGSGEDAGVDAGGVTEDNDAGFTACPLGTPPPPPVPSGGCQGGESGAVLGVLTVLGSDGSVLVNASIPAVLPVDVAASPDGSTYAVVAPGNAFVSTNLNTVLTFDQCGNSAAPGQVVGTGGVSEQPIAVAYDPAGDLIVQTREPASLWILGSTSDARVALSTTTRADTGFDIFHVQAGGMIACASCHPEGRDDGHVWILDGDKRRTPSLRGTIAGTAPYHWPGDEPNLNVLVNDVYTVRMDGAPLSTAQMSAITGWVQNVAAPPAPSWVDTASAARGKALFESAATGCVTCHSGTKFTNNLTLDVGTGGAFQVPPLVGVGWRTPLMHDGCATTLADRFGACATPQHGSTGTLSQQDVSDLVAYLETL